ncbi:MAG TPA: DSD1 family PLP-dependent enzyme [Acidobacteria bacterium]|jgi:D-serine deaminase-like pyridoxal phosphate-dependent protein|nr:DSD1 family PLP-dependent enzyme [Acidobacteriota bacterium]
MTQSVSRRHFLAAGAGAASVWIPRPVKGYSAAEMRQQAVNDRIEVGISKWDLDTPCLCVDLDRLDRNLDRMQTTVARNGIASRPHAKTHKCPAIARLQLATGSVGICTAKISEAEVMFEHGIEQVLMTTVNVTPRKIRRAMRLRKRYESFTQAVDTAANARDLSAAATEAGVVADIVVDIDPGGHRTGITAGAPALELAQLVDTLPGLRLRGLLCYDGGAQHVTGFADRRRRALGSLEAAAETAVQMTRAGLDTGIFSGGGTGTYNIDHETSGLTDVQVGSYVFMDAQYLAIGGAEDPEVYTDFETALTVLTTVLNAQYAGRATTDAGAKANTINRPWPVIAGETGMTYTAGSDEFGTIRYEANASRVYAVGDKLELIVSHCDPVVNLYDQLYGVRGDTVEVVWPIAGRGKSI